MTAKWTKAFYTSSLQLTISEGAAYALLRGRVMSDTGPLDKNRRETGTDLAPDKKEARSDRGTESDASAALAALARGPKLQSESCISVTEYFEPGQQ